MEVFFNNEDDPDITFYNKVFTIGKPHLPLEKIQANFKSFLKSLLTNLHLNIRILKKESVFKAFKQFLFSHKHISAKISGKRRSVCIVIHIIHSITD